MSELAAAVHGAGGEIIHELGIIHAVGAHLTHAQREALEAHPAVARIYEDRAARIAAAPGTSSLTLAPVADSELDEANPSLNLGTAVELGVESTPDAERRAIYDFDLSPLPANASIVSATLALWVNGGGGLPIDVHRITGGWSEEDVSWSSAGDGVDPAADASFTPSGAGSFATVDVTSLVQAWTSGLLDEHGLMLVGDVAGPATRFASNDWPLLEHRPYLEITYVELGGAGIGGGTSQIWSAEDRFDDVSYRGDDGDVPWLGRWREIGENDGPRRGKVRVVDYGDGEQGLRIRNRRRGIDRRIDLAGKDHAVLVFDVLRAGFESGNGGESDGDSGDDSDSGGDSDSGDDSDSGGDSNGGGGRVPHVKVKISSDGGDSWALLGRIPGIDDTEPTRFLYDLRGHLSASTRLRFVTSRRMKNRERVIIDNVRIVGDDEIHGADLPPDRAPPYSDYPTLVDASDLHAQGLTGEGVTIAVIDTGLWPWHSLLRDTSGQPRTYVRYDATSSHLYQGEDNNGHGTHVTSVMLSSAQPLDQPGIYNGIAPDAGLVAIKAFDQHGQGTYMSLLHAMDWLLRHRETFGIRVLNLSFSAPLRSYYWEDPLNQAVMAAWQAGLVVVTSAGNGGPDPMTIGVPGNVPYVMTVGAMTDAFTPMDLTDDQLSFYSAAGPTIEGFVKPDLVAPGGHMLGVLDPGSLLALQHPERLVDGGFTMSGTSQAAAVVSGLVALMLQADPWLVPDEVKCRLMDSGRAAVDGLLNLAYSPFQQGTGLVSATGALGSGESNCANTGLDVTRDLDDLTHYAGPARWDPADGYYIEGVGYFWDGTLDGGGVLWLDATPWVNGAPWTDGLPWTDATPWVNATSWVNATPWVNNAHVWSAGLTEMTSVNLWIP